ncbi:hypothetical protein EFA69_14185 [Rufibacter immobilis]|uniref:Uncharacterized protein n=1 Tax=Rufibacter immobilis TaxID=1348778 RepID=A0A3M9MQY6_9BACT|nr:CFI-box-CTERM domain-containing protein [Rufibacter immobilis]RNI27293.1 hypothetical protein EFA69_14185 [Rufibacter immobilis]
MEEIYDDYELNRRANTILDTIEKTGAPVAAGGMMGSFNETGLKIAKGLLDRCLPDLAFIKSRVSSNDEIYLQLSDTLAVMTSGIIKMPVSSISMLANTSGFHSDSTNVQKMKSELAEATRLMSIISNLDLTPRARQTINQNLNQLNEAEKRVNKKSGGCYIATCVYGNYNSKEVMVLRSFRDNVLSTKTGGKHLIRLYYQFSPILVKYLGTTTSFRKLARFFLDKFINRYN